MGKNQKFELNLGTHKRKGELVEIIPAGQRISAAKGMTYYGPDCPELALQARPVNRLVFKVFNGYVVVPDTEHNRNNVIKELP